MVLDRVELNKKRLIASIGILMLVMVFGTLGFVILGDSRSTFDGLVLTIVIITTVGMKLHDMTMTRAEEVWAIFLMLAGISTALYAAGHLVAFIIDGELRSLLGRLQLQNKISRLKDHYIVCGFGRMGRALCETLAEKKAPFVLIENNPDRTTEADQLGYLYVFGNAMDELRMRDARIETARGLTSCLRSDSDNVFVTLTARGLNENLTIIARAENENANNKLKRAGANRVICPPVIGANKVAQMMLQPAVDELWELAVTGEDMEVSKVKAGQIPAMIGKSLMQLELPAKTGLMVVAVVHPNGERAFNPPPTFAPKEDDELIVIGPTGGVEKMMQLLNKTAGS